MGVRALHYWSLTVVLNDLLLEIEIQSQPSSEFVIGNADEMQCGGRDHHSSDAFDCSSFDE